VTAVTLKTRDGRLHQIVVHAPNLCQGRVTTFAASGEEGAMGGEGEDPRYRAFISYSHRDAAFGRRLHRRLEAYAVPRRLVGRPGLSGPVPARLAPIFRDREELPAAHDLTAEVRAALAASASLVVVCSPAAAASPWVAREVELFRDLHPGRPILAALVDGEPADAFPAPLRCAAEPLAADFRPHRDGERLALLKLVAGMVGVGLDQLVQRDAQRRVRRVTVVTAGSVAAMLAMGVLTAFALSARAEADRQRAEAEGMVEFMLTDLRSKLKGVGRLDIMGAVNARALGYYAHQDLRRLPDASLERRARTLHAMAEDDELRGDLSSASLKLLEARRTTSELLAKSPLNAQRIFDHAQSEYWVAFIEWRRNRYDAAEAGFIRYAALAAQLLSIDPNNPDWQMEGGYAASNLGMLALRDKGDAARAQRLFTQALGNFRAAERQRPQDGEIKASIADGYGWLGDSQRALRLTDEAMDSRYAEQRILLQLQRRDPANAVYPRALLGNALGLAKLEIDRGQLGNSERRLSSAYMDAARLASADPADEKLAKQRIAIGVFLAKVRLDEGQPPSVAFRSLGGCSQPAARADPELSDFCSVIRARILAHSAGSDLEVQKLLSQAKRQIRTRLSPRWGIDFVQEINSVQQRGTGKWKMQ
jgi:tetratricopeptide (TPR) repeat protein